MPWKVGTMSEVRLAFVQEILELKRSVAATCRKYGISRKTGYKWLTRYTAAKDVPAKDVSATDVSATDIAVKDTTVSEVDLMDRSRRPRSSPRRSPEPFEAEVLRVRDSFGWGAPKIWAFLRNEAEKCGVERDLASERTIGNILQRHGRVRPTAVNEVPPQFFERSQPHQLWQCDFKGPLEVERQRVHPFTVLDDHSRYLLALHVCLDVTMASAWKVLWVTFGEHGLPEKLLCDGAFAAAHSGIKTVSWIEGRLLRLGIEPVHGRPYHPQTQGKIERLHGTLQREVWPIVDRSNQQNFARQLERWRTDVYNSLRPHESLGGRPPLARYQPNPRRRPAQLPEVSYATGSVLRKVANGGDISWCGYRILVGAGLTGELVAIEDEDRTVNVRYAFKRIRQIPHEQLRRDHLL